MQFFSHDSDAVDRSAQKQQSHYEVLHFYCLASASTCSSLPAPQYEAGSAPSLALKATIERTEKRFANYGKAGLLCGADGLPHLISDPGLALRYGHAGEVFVSGQLMP